MSIGKKFLIVVGIALGVIAIVGYVVGYQRMVAKVQSLVVVVTLDRSVGERDFPAIDTTSLTDTQRSILAITQSEFATQPTGTKYSDGVQESWCADFASWVMRGAGKPLRNPNSGSWRIPGTFTLKDYYVAAGRFRAVDSGYTAKLGDVAIYRNSPVFGDHTNIVLTNKDGILTTVGGNENNRIRVFVNSHRRYDGLLGYGVLEG